MIRLNLSREPTWLDLGHDVRVRVAPLTTSLMAAARSDPAVGALPEGASNETIAVTMAKALARLVVLEWEGVGDAEGNPVPVTPEGIDALLDILPIFEAFQVRYVSKGLLLEAEKTAPRPRRMAFQRGRPVLPILSRYLQRMPRRPESSADDRRLAGLGSSQTAHGAIARRPRCGPRPRHDGRARLRTCAWSGHPRLRGTAARGGGHDGARTERANQD
ncbi:conserved protein [Tepidicaulis marinus]|uniref:Conserved protein n=1 Tax=Tepidicaulis marinus TaxID=1333998 RepID=A0A081BFR4_9HYPH|nr:hypothetical protein [Tepidicaulis marinus]GAK46882.1 conserved protein [Tepidicaulis marinus]